MTARSLSLLVAGLAFFLSGASALVYQVAWQRILEIASPQTRLLRALDRRVDFPRLHRLLRDPRVDVVTADGRHALGLGDARYDIIEADALCP